MHAAFRPMMCVQVEAGPIMNHPRPSHFGIDKLDQSALARRHAVLSAGELLVTGTAASERSSTDAQRGLSLFKLGNLCS
ncbi:MAG: hypothetical protein E5W69_03235, partial [Mesorhizobium sp.]